MDTQENIKDLAQTLNLVNYQIADLSKIKAEIENKLFKLLDHPDDCSKTYTQDKFKITITTGYNYTLDKDEYSVLKDRLPACFNPVTEKISYQIDKKVIREAEKYGSSADLDLLGKIVSKKPKKLHVKISAAV